MAPAAVPEIPIAAMLAVGLLAFTAWLIFRGLLAGYVHTFGYLLDRLAGVLKFKIRYAPDVDLGGPVRALNHGIQHTLAAGASKSEHAMGYMFHGAARLQEWTTREIRTLAHETLGWAVDLEHVKIPRWLKIAASVALPPLALARLIRAAVRAELPHLTRVVRVVEKQAGAGVTRTVALPYLGQWQWIHRHWRALTAAVAAAGALAGAGALPWVHIFPRVRVLERFEVLTRKRLRRLEALLGVTGLAIALANVLGLPNWRCLTRGNVGRTARAICGIPSHLLNDLLGLVVDFFVLTNICEVITLLNEGFGVVAGPLADFAGAAGGALCHGDYSAPPAHPVAAFTVPPLQARSAPQAA